MSSINLFSSPGQRPCELLPSGFVCRPSYVVVVVVCRKLFTFQSFLDTISCNGMERNETKRNDFVSCFSNYYRDITTLRNETIPFRVLVISYRWTVLSYFVPTKTQYDTLDRIYKFEDKQMQTGMTLGQKCFVTQFSTKEVLYYADFLKNYWKCLHGEWLRFLF
jgi:hypothetical protein